MNEERTQEELHALLKQAIKERNWLASQVARRECRDVRNEWLDVKNPTFTRAYWIEKAEEAAAAWEEV